MPDPLDHLDSISLIPDLYSNNSKQDLHGPLKHVYNRKTYHGEQCLLFNTVSLIDSTEYCGRKWKEGECYKKAIIRDPDPEVKLYHRVYLQCLGNSACLKQELQQSKCRDLLCSKQEPLKHAHSPEGLLLCPNSDPLKHTHLPQGILSLIDPTGCYVMKRKDEEWYWLYIEKPVADIDYAWGNNESMSISPTVPEARLNNQHNILLFHCVRSMISRGYINLQHLASEWNFADILTKNWSYKSSYYELIQPFFRHSGNTAALFLDNTLGVDVSIAEESIFDILRSEKRSKKPMADGEQMARMYSMYTTVRRVLPVQ